MPLHIHVENRWRLGDEVMALPFYDLVRKAHPGARITISVNYPELLYGRDFLHVDFDRDEFDCDLYLFIKDDARSQQRLEHLCSLFAVPYEPLSPTIASNEDRPAARYIAYSTGAGWSCKSLPTALLRDVVSELQATYPQYEFLELGKDCESTGIGRNMIDACNIREVMNLLLESAVYIGPDSGLTHLALALGTPSVAVYGPVRPDKAFGKRDNLYPVHARTECHGCWTDGRMIQPGVCPLGTSSVKPEDYACMGSLSCDEVVTAIKTSGYLDTK